MPSSRNATSDRSPPPPAIRSQVCGSRRAAALVGWLIASTLISTTALAQSSTASTKPSAHAPAATATVPATAATFPATERQNVRDTYFGTTLDDPYRWLEDTQAANTQAWMKAASAHARGILDGLPQREPILKRLQALDAGTTTRIGEITRTASGRLVYQRRRASDNQFVLVMRDGFDGAESVLVDPNAMSKAAGGKAIAINYFTVSPDGRTLAYGLSEGGSEAAILHLLDIASRQPVGEPIDRANWGIARFSPDGRYVTFNRLAAPTADKLSKYQNSAIWWLPVGGKAADAREILGPQTRSQPGHPPLQPHEITFVRTTDDGRWLVATIIDGVRRELRVWIAPINQASELGQSTPRWQQIIDYRDKIVDFAIHQQTLYAVSHDGAPRFKIIGAPLANFAASTASTLVAGSDKVIGSLAAARDALYFEARSGNAKQLWKIAHGAQAAPQQVNLPLQGTFSLRSDSGTASLPTTDGVLIGLEDWTHARQIYRVDAQGQAHNTGLQPAGPFDNPPDIDTTEVLVTARDGSRVPLSIIHRKGLKLDGRNPTLLAGYAAYGLTIDPRFDINRLAWLERGVVLAFANPRGSGVFGQSWYEAGKLQTKPNTWRDMIDCAQYLLAQKYASPTTLAISGGSAGGITSGRAATERPDLFAAVVPRVGALDTVRMELEPNGPPNIPEFGSVKTEDGLRGLLAMSTYHHIHPGVRYPAVLLTHGVNDPRVAVWQSTKTGAAFEAARASVSDGRPVLIRLDYDAGHGVGNTKTQAQQETADIYAFLLWQMGGGKP